MFVANWKMNIGRSQAAAYCERLSELYNQSQLGDVQIAIAPPYTSIDTVSSKLRDTPIRVAAQNVHWLQSGAHTGEISPTMLIESGVTLAIVGHSERRQNYGETSQRVALRALAAVKNSLQAIVCIGESAADFEQGRTGDVVHDQLVQSLEGFDSRTIQHVVIAYEPIWAIGTGVAISPADAAKVHGQIRDILRNRFGKRETERTRIIYGGSTNPENIGQICAEPNVDGALVGGASLEPKTFLRLIATGEEALLAKSSRSD